MNTISQEFAILPGVVGSCVFDRDKGIFFSNLPKFFTNLMVEEASNNIRRMIQMAEVKGLSPQTMSIRYDIFNIIAMPVKDSAILLILCEPSSNASLISTTASMLGSEIAKALDQEPGEAIKTQASKASEVAGSNPKTTDKQTSQALTSIKQALFDTVGPIADMVYDECLERWTATNPPDVARIFELIGCISGEIDNPELFEEFKGKITTLL